MSMFYHFLAINHDNPNDLTRQQELFKDTQIYQDREFCQQYMGHYPVIFLSLKSVEGINFETAYQKLAEIIYGLVDSQFRFLLQSNELSDGNKRDLQYLLDLDNLEKVSSSVKLQFSLQKLTQFLYQHYGKKDNMKRPPRMNANRGFTV